MNTVTPGGKVGYIAKVFLRSMQEKEKQKSTMNRKGKPAATINSERF